VPQQLIDMFDLDGVIRFESAAPKTSGDVDVQGFWIINAHNPYHANSILKYTEILKNTGIS